MYKLTKVKIIDSNSFFIQVGESVTGDIMGGGVVLNKRLTVRNPSGR